MSVYIDDDDDEVEVAPAQSSLDLETSSYLKLINSNDLPSQHHYNAQSTRDIQVRNEQHPFIDVRENTIKNETTNVELVYSIPYDMHKMNCVHSCNMKFVVEPVDIMKIIG
jgi:hypothetical protein